MSHAGMTIGTPGMFNVSTTEPIVPEAQRHLAQSQLQPITNLIAEEVITKFGSPISIDFKQLLQAFDAGGRVRATAQVPYLLTRAKAA